MLTERRKSQRITWNLPATALWADSVRRPCLVRDVSAGGARVAVEDTAKVPMQITLALTQNGQVARRCRVVWRSGTDIGLAFQSATAIPMPSTKDEGLSLDC